MRKLVLALSALSLAAAAALAGPAEDSSALMKERGKIVGGLVKVAKGETPFDAAAVLKELQALQVNAAAGAEVEKLWPSKDGADDEASPKIWEDPAGFKAAADKFKADVDAAVAAPPTDVAALGATLGAVTKNCGDCHEMFRVKK